MLSGPPESAFDGEGLAIYINSPASAARIKSATRGFKKSAREPLIIKPRLQLAAKAHTGCSHDHPRQEKREMAQWLRRLLSALVPTHRSLSH